MNVHIEVIRPTRHLRATLLSDGWKVESERQDDLWVSHLQVADEGGARGRLNRLGLLTSSSLRIDFPLAIRPGADR